MLPYQYSFAFPEETGGIEGCLELDDPVQYPLVGQKSAFYRQGRIKLSDCGLLELVLYHNRFTEKFIYLRDTPIDTHLLQLVGFPEEKFKGIEKIRLPGQLCLGAERVEIIGEAINGLIASPVLRETISGYQQHNLAIFPIAREGLKYQVAESIFRNYQFYCDEIVLDAHHVFDSSIPVYNRKVEMTLFKDKDLDAEQKKNIKVAFIADSIASGLVLKEVIGKVKERFDHIQQVEVIAPLATIRGLCRIAKAPCVQDIRVRVHVFETLLNALPPDYYYSAHYNIDQLHICPELEKVYREWWGSDPSGNQIADTACAGYGWSEVFFSPRKQLEMINGELMQRHKMTIDQILARSLG